MNMKIFSKKMKSTWFRIGELIPRDQSLDALNICKTIGEKALKQLLVALPVFSQNLFMQLLAKDLN